MANSPNWIIRCTSYLVFTLPIPDYFIAIIIVIVTVTIIIVIIATVVIMIAIVIEFSILSWGYSRFEIKNWVMDTII